MADYSRTWTSVTSVTDIVEKIRDFLVAAPTGPGWTEDSTWTNASHSGELLIRNDGEIQGYFYALASSSKVEFYWLPPTSNGYGSSSGPSNHYSESGIGFLLSTSTKNYSLYSFADADRAVFVLRGQLKPGQVGSFTSTTVDYQIVYMGGYTPGDVTNDDYPIVLLGNGGMLSSALDSVENGLDWGFFPEAMIKALQPGDTIAHGLHRLGNPRFAVTRQPSWKPVKNSYGSEAFGFQQGIEISWPGAEYAFTLSGMYLTHGDVGAWNEVSIGENSYISVPSNSFVQPLLGVPSMYLIPKGTVI